MFNPWPSGDRKNKQAKNKDTAMQATVHFPTYDACSSMAVFGDASSS